jgi:hypothetical protein
MNANQTTIESEDNETLSTMRHRLALAIKDGQTAVEELYEDVCRVLRNRRVFV